MSDNRNIILVGFMGTGKSTIGRKLAERLGRRHLDMDDAIEERAGKKIADIFAEDGEAAFRNLERAMVQELAGQDALVIAPGGGIVLDHANIEDFERTGVVVCLQASPEKILQRVEVESHRPLLEGGDKVRKISELLSKRKHLYDAIDHQIDTTDMGPDQVADRVLALFDAA